MEKINDSVIRNRENLSILKGIDESNFNKLVKWFSSEKEANKIILSWFLNSTNINLAKLWDIKIDINHIKNYIRNKPDISKNLECKIAKLYLEKIYKLWTTNIPFMMGIKEAFDIENKADIENKKLDFKTIQVNIQKLSDRWEDKINSVSISNDEIFDLLGNDINKYTNFQSQSISSQTIILDLLNFEVKWIIDYVKSWWEKADKDMENVVLPISNISDIFDEIQDPEIQKLTIQKWKIEEFLFVLKDEIGTTEKTFLKEKINELSSAWFDDKFISQMKKLLLWKIKYSQVKDFLQKEIRIINKKTWKKYIEGFEKNGKNPEFIATIKKLYSNDFDFSTLDKKEQTKLWQTLVTSKFDKNENSWIKYAWLNQEKYISFLKYLYDFSEDKTLVTITWDWLLNLDIKKEVIWWENKSFIDPENFKNMDVANPIRFIVNIDNNDKNIIHDLEETKDSPLRVNWIMETHTTKWWELNIWNGYKLGICGKKITKFQLDELLECDYDDEKLNKKLKEFWLYEELKHLVISTKKAMFNTENVYYDYDENWVAQNNDNWYGPYWYKYCIFEEMLKKLDVKVLERNLILEWENINKLSQLYIMSKIWLNEEKEKNKNQDNAIKNILWDYDREWDEELWGKEKWEPEAIALWEKIKDDYLNGNWGNDDNEDDNYFIQYDIEEKAGEYRDKLNSEWKDAFEKKLTELLENDPDLDSDGKDDIRQAINDLIDDLKNPNQSVVSSTSTTTATTEKEKTPEEEWQESWNSLLWDKESEECKKITKWMRLYFDLWESQLPPKDITDAEKSFYCFEVINVTEKDFTIRAIWWDLKSSLTGKEYTLKKTAKQLDSMKKWGSIYRVRNGAKRDRNSCIESINKAWFFKKFTAFGNMEGQVRLDWNKFVNNKWEEIKYFDRVEWVFDNSNDDKSKRWQWEKIYKYEIKKINTSKWTVQLASKFDWHDKNYNDVVYEYENEISFEQFILLMEWKRLKWYTEDQQKEMETKYSIDDPKRLATKWMRRWVSIWSIINVFKNTTKAIKSKLDERQKEQEEDLENYLFSQEWLDLYWKLWWLFWNSAMGDAIRKSQYEFYTNRENRTWKKIETRYKIFEADPNYSEFFNEHLQHILSRQWYVGNDKDRYKFAAALLIMVKKEWPYPRVFANQKDKWKRVENILGPEHKTRFLNFYNKKKNELEQEKDLWHQSWARLALQEELNKMEIQYIVSTIDWRAPYGPASNEFMLKSIWSLKFMSTLEENMKWYYNKHDEEKNSLETFYAAEESYLRNIWSGKFQKALPALERMCETAKTPWEVYRIKWYILGAMLMWIIKNNSSAKTIKSFWATCRAMWFAPWYRMRDIEQQDKVKALLDWVTNGEFSKETKFNISDFEPGNIKDWKYSFGKLFQWYRNSHGEDILEKIENPTYKKGDWDKSIIDLANEKDNPNNYIFKDIIKNSTTNEIDSMSDKVNPIFARESPLSATSNMVKYYIPKNGKYSKLKSEEDVSNAEDFWTKASEKIPSWESDKETVDFMFKKYFNWFDDIITTDIQKIILRSLPLIKEENKTNRHNAEYMLWYMLKWHIHDKTRWAFPPEFEQVMNKFIDFFYANLNKIDKDTIKSTFDDSDVIKAYDKPYVQLWWRDFYNRYMNWQPRERNRYKQNARLELLKREKEESDAINYKIDTLWKNTKEYATPNISFDQTNSDNTINVWDLTDKKIQEEYKNLWELWYSSYYL